MAFLVSIFLWTMISSHTSASAKASDLWGLDFKTSKNIEIDFKKSSRGTVVVFISARCPCSASHVSEIAALTKEFSSKGFQFVVVHSNVNEIEASDRSYLQSLDVGAPILEDHEAEIANRFGASKTPHAFIISPAGNVVYMGAVSDHPDFSKAKEKYLRVALSQILQGVSVDPSKTMSMGCAIRR